MVLELIVYSVFCAALVTRWPHLRGISLFIFQICNALFSVRDDFLEWIAWRRLAQIKIDFWVPHACDQKSRKTGILLRRDQLTDGVQSNISFQQFKDDMMIIAIAPISATRACTENEQTYFQFGFCHSSNRQRTCYLDREWLSPNQLSASLTRLEQKNGADVRKAPRRWDSYPDEKFGRNFQ